MQKKIIQLLGIIIFTLNSYSQTIEVCTSCKVKTLTDAIAKAKPHNKIIIQKGTYLESSGAWSDGQLYHAISAGSASGIMLGLSDKLTPKERWAVVLYVRTLQDFVGKATNKIGS